MKKITRRTALAALILSIVTPISLQLAYADDAPKVIRFGSPFPGVGNKPVGFGNAYATAQTKALFEQEFKKDGIKVEWSNFKGAGPAVNEALANNQLDFTWLGDLPALIGNASGIKTKLLLAGGTHFNLYLAVPAGSTAKSIADLKGKKVAEFKGTAVQLAVDKIYAKYGFTDRDFRTINLDGATGTAALESKNIDALWGASNLIAEQDKGAARIIYDSGKEKNDLNLAGYVLVTSDFEKKYPKIVQRVVNVLVKEAAWTSDPNNKTAVLKLWALSGIPYSSLVTDSKDVNFNESQSPLLDEYFYTVINHSIAVAKQDSLLRGNVDARKWADPRYLNIALEALNLTKTWKPLDANGNPTH